MPGGQIAKGTVKVIVSKDGVSNTYGVDTASVTRKMNYEWNVAEINTNGYTIPFEYGSTFDIYFERAGIGSIKRFTG